MKLYFDPRTKLFLLVLSNLALFMHISLPAEILLVSLLLIPFFMSDKEKIAVKMALLYITMITLDVFLIPVAKGIVLNLISMFSVGIRIMLPCIISGAYAFSTTSVGEMVSALRKLKVPETIIIPCVTVIRFFPTIAEDYRQIRSAMAFRGISTGKAAMLCHPARSLEYILMPLLMNSNNVAQDISVAAMTKGISMPGNHTSMRELKMTVLDWIYMGLCTLPFVLYLKGVL